MEKILVIGAHGQIGSVLTQELKKKFSNDQVIASDLRVKDGFEGLFEILDATDKGAIERVVATYKITQIYHLAAILSAKGEENPLGTWEINMKTMFNVFEVARLYNVDKVFFPSSIGVFGDSALSDATPQRTFLDPTTVYGISKAAGENWSQYYFKRYGLDIRSLRYPGIIGYQSLPGGGTTDYAVDIYHKAVNGEDFVCFLDEHTVLPMIFMDDAIRATIELMDTPKENIRTRTSYNLASMSFSPDEIFAVIQKSIPSFKISYQPDFRQQIADSWPKSIDDSEARMDWGWHPEYDLEAMTKVMLEKLSEQYHAVV